MIKDHYKTLGIERTASPAQVKAAYRRLAFAWHPDRNPSPGAHQTFVEINAAYEVLRNPISRARYDTLCRVDFRHGRPAHERRYEARRNAWETKVHRTEQRGERKAERRESRPPPPSWGQDASSVSWTGFFVEFLLDLVTSFWFW